MCTFPGLRVIEELSPMTNYGQPSDFIQIGNLGTALVAFLPRHGRMHSIPPHKVPYKANLAALAKIGAGPIVGTCIAGSLKRDIAPGTFVIPDQFVNLTWGRDDSFAADGGAFQHVPMAEPYCGCMRALLRQAADDSDLRVRDGGTVAVIQGPRFGTTAESRWLASNGWDIVNMTQYPECYFARELGICYAAVAAITDYDVGIKEGAELAMSRETMPAILKIFRKNVRQTRSLLCELAESVTRKFSCKCSSNETKPYYKR